jgi:hypothetical protein
MGLVVLPSTLTNGTTADADQVMADLNALVAQVNGHIGTVNLEDASVTTPKLADGSVTGPKLGAGAVTAGAIAAKAAAVYHNADQALPFQVETTLAFNSERFDTDLIHDPAVNNSRLTCKTAGVYNITGTIHLNPAFTSTFTILSIRLNGATILSQVYDKHISTGEGHFGMNVSTIYQLAVNDYVELRVFHSQNDGSGGAPVQAVGNYSPSFAMACLGA